MPVFQLDPRVAFPDPDFAEPDGLLAVGGDLRPARLLLAYSIGIFPWFNEGDPILWWSPDPRCVVLRGEEHIPRSTQRKLRRGDFEIRLDTAFEAVMRACAASPRKGQDGTWIHAAMVEAYVALHRAGYAHSIEAWQGGELAGGLYGVSLGAAFFGESMFARVPDASKAAFAALCAQAWAWGFGFIDAQVPTEHLHRLGARDVPRDAFRKRLAQALEAPTRRGPWRLSPEALAGLVGN
ncbi:MAG: leucyl/phenylalanyl-tRNA--protein transferase [Holophagaceae bacterium]